MSKPDSQVGVGAKRCPTCEEFRDIIERKEYDDGVIGGYIVYKYECKKCRVEWVTRFMGRMEDVNIMIFDLLKAVDKFKLK